MRLGKNVSLDDDDFAGRALDRKLAAIDLRRHVLNDDAVAPLLGDQRSAIDRRGPRLSGGRRLRAALRVGGRGFVHGL